MPQAKSPEKLDSRAPFSLKAIAIYTVLMVLCNQDWDFPKQKN